MSPLHPCHQQGPAPSPYRGRPLSSRIASPTSSVSDRSHSKSPKATYASKAATKPADTLARAQELLQLAPSHDLLEAIKMAKTLPIKGQPSTCSSRKTATIQGSQASSCVISVPTLVHQGIVKKRQRNTPPFMTCPANSSPHQWIDVT